MQRLTVILVTVDGKTHSQRVEAASPEAAVAALRLRVGDHEFYRLDLNTEIRFVNPDHVISIDVLLGDS